MKVYPLKQSEKEASENISNICARIRHIEFMGREVFKDGKKKERQ